MKKIKLIFIGSILIGIFSSAAFAQSPRRISSQGIKPNVGVDKRIELLTIIWRLAGSSGFRQGSLQPYISEVDKHFAPHGNHAAVLIAREMIKQGFDNSLVATIAIHTNDPYELRERVLFDAPGGILDQYGLPAPMREQFLSGVRRFLPEARKFAVESRAKEFFAAHQKLYDEAGSRMKKVIEQHADLKWYQRFYGQPSGADFFVVPLLATSEISFGPNLPGIGTRPEIYAILSVSNGSADADGIPIYSPDRVKTLIHEFNHSYVNKLLETNSAQVEQSGLQIFAAVENQMRDQGNPNWRVVLGETLVRAAVARYLLEHEGAEKAGAEIAGQKGKGYIWMQETYDLLGEYEVNRKKYPAFDSFMPRIIEYINRLPARIETLKKNYDASRPRVASLSIENGSQNIDPALTEIIVKFDRPMQKTAPELMWDVRPMRGGRDRFPAITKQEFVDDGSTYRLLVKLEPNRSYEFELNRSTGGAFVSKESVPLAPYKIQFKTR